MKLLPFAQSDGARVPDDGSQRIVHMCVYFQLDG